MRFGSTVTLEKEDGTRVTYQIVGEDEAEPAKGKISYVAPIATLLIGTAVSDTVALVNEEPEIVRIA